jgi:hypothetical protein
MLLLRYLRGRGQLWGCERKKMVAIPAVNRVIINVELVMVVAAIFTRVTALQGIKTQVLMDALELG